MKNYLLNRAPRVIAAAIVMVLLAGVGIAQAADGKPDDAWHFAVIPTFGCRVSVAQ